MSSEEIKTNLQDTCGDLGQQNSRYRAIEGYVGGAAVALRQGGLLEPETHSAEQICTGMAEVAGTLQEIHEEEQALMEALRVYALHVLGAELQVPVLGEGLKIASLLRMQSSVRSSASVLPKAPGLPARGAADSRWVGKLARAEEYEPDQVEKMRQALQGDVEYREVLKRLDDLLSRIWGENIGSIRAAMTTASILSEESPKDRQAFGAAMRTKRVSYPLGDAYVGASYRLHELKQEYVTVLGTPIEVLVMATDVITHNETSVYPAGEDGKNAKRIAEITQGVKEHLEYRYNITADSKEAVGFLAECRIRELLGKDASPEIIAAQDKRIATAWGKIHPSNLSNEIAKVYYEILGIGKE